MQLRVLDLFSGIGGFSLALQSLAKTVAYCDIDPRCQATLQKNIDLHKLDAGPIYADVRNLPIKEITRMQPTCITAGFPCQDISHANPHGKGLNGEKSGLFKEIVKLVDILPSVNIVFLENSANIVNKQLHKILNAFQRRGFNTKYCIINAKDVGAPHKRMRWYCLCIRNIEPDVLPHIPHSKLLDNTNAWTKLYMGKKYIVTKTIAEKSQYKERCGMLGNSIVPACAMYTWNYLVDSHKNDTFTINPPPFNKAINQKILLSDGTKIVKRSIWGTPTRSVWSIYQTITPRAASTLSSQIYFSDGINNKTEPIHRYIANPNFIEYLMGYPKDWTKL